MEISLKEQIAFALPEDWASYLVGDASLETFKFYPLLISVLALVLAAMVALFFMAKKNRRSRPLARFLKTAGKVALIEFLIGSFVLFSRWQTLGIFTLRIFLVGWLLSLPVVCVVFICLYFFRYKAMIRESGDKESLSKYIPG